jgi:hypothetical protein
MTDLNGWRRLALNIALIPVAAVLICGLILIAQLILFNGH